MAPDEEPPDDLRVRLTWPRPSSTENAPFDYAGEPKEDDQAANDYTPAVGNPVTPPAPRPPVGRTSPGYGAERESGQDAQLRRPLGRWAAGRRSAAQRAAEARTQAARAAAERVATERGAAQRAADQGGESRQDRDQSAEGRGGPTYQGGVARQGQPHDVEARQGRTEQRPFVRQDPAPITGLRAAEEAAARIAAERAEAMRLAEREAAERDAAEREAADRADAQRVAAQRAAAERAAAERAAAETAARRAEAEAAARRAAAQRAEAERAAADRAAARAAAERAAAEDAARAEEADAEAEAALRRAAAERAEAESRRRPLLTVDAEDDDEDDEHERASRPTVTTQELILAGRTDSLQAALASIALRIDALTSTTSTFRNLISDRITDYAEQVGRLGASAAGDLDDYRHLHERALEQIRRSVGEAEDNIRRLTRSVGDLDSKVAALVAAVRESGDVVDQMVSERDQVSDTVVRTLARVEDTLAELTEGKGASSFARLSDMIGALTAERDRQMAVWAELEQVVVALADDREHSSDVMGRLERGISEMTVGRERGLAKALARLEARIDEVAGAMTGIAGDDMAATLTRLDTRLKEMSTELVVGRDRETAKALAQLSGQVDGLAGMIAEGRADLSPIEARLNRMARTAPPAAPVDLAGLYARLDELVDVVGRGTAPPGRGLATAPIADNQLLDRFDQLGQQLGEQLEALRRRIALRARATAPALDEASIAAIADAVVARLQQAATPEVGTPRRSMLTENPPPLSRPVTAAPRTDIVPEGPRRGRAQWRDT
jgi:uncharacterized protein YoxC